MTTTSLNVLYAGDAGTERETAYAEFLREHVATVKTVGRDELCAADLEGIDVLIVDGEPMTANPVTLTLDDLRVPTMLVGGAGGRLADHHQLKLGWEYG